MTAPIVFIHGLKGGQLRDADGHRRWLSPLQALGLDRRRLALSLHYDGKGQLRDGLRADEPLGSVLGVKVYTPFLDWAARHSELHTFAYDWRRDPGEAVTDFETFLEDTVAAAGRPVLIVAHSMGGLITFLTLRRRPELAAGVVFAGAPFGTGVGFTEDMHHGARAGLNGRILDACTHATWGSPWWFFPETGDSHARGPGGKPLDVDWYDPACWRARGLGVYAGSVEPDMVAHHGRAMASARARRALLSDPGALADTTMPIAVLTGVGRECVHTIRLSKRGWSFRGHEVRDGDGRVSATSTRLLVDLPHRHWTTTLAHDRLLDDTAVLGEILEWMQS